MRFPSRLAILGSGCIALTSSVLMSEQSAAADTCDWYIVLHCGTSAPAANSKLADLGGPNAGGGAGLKVINTRSYPNLRKGFLCVVDGPYDTSALASAVAWSEAVPDAYIKKGCP